GAWLLPRLVGLQRAKELVFLGDALDAAAAERLGLVNRVVPAEELEAVAGEWAARLAAGPTRALGLAKSLLNRSLDSDRATAFGEEARAQGLNRTTRDANEGVRSFVGRRDPEYLGWCPGPLPGPGGPAGTLGPCLAGEPGRCSPVSPSPRRPP